MLHYVVVAVLAVVLLVPSFAVPAYLGRGAEWVRLPQAQVGDPASLAALEDGVRLEREGDLLAALQKYRAAVGSKVDPLRTAAGYAVDRVNAKLDRIAPVYSSLRTLSDWSHTLRVPVVLAAVLALLLLVTRLLTPRRGRIEIRRFTVVSESESGPANFFYRLLNEEVARIARVFHSDQLPDIGAAAIRARPLDSGLSDTENRAIAAVEKGEVKSVIGFVFSEIMNQFRDLGALPDYVVTGIVVLRSREIVASAQFVPLRGRESRSLEASSAEIATVRYQAPRPMLRPGAVAARSAAAEGPQDAERLADVARVLACKLSQCWMVMEQGRLNRRHVQLNRWRAWLDVFLRTRSVGLAAGAMSVNLPATWQTIHDQVSAMNTLEVRR